VIQQVPFIGANPSYPQVCWLLQLGGFVAPFVQFDTHVPFTKENPELQILHVGGFVAPFVQLAFITQFPPEQILFPEHDP